MNDLKMILMSMAGVLLFISLIGYFGLRFVRTMNKRTQEYYDKKEQLLKSLIDTLSADDIERYKLFPDHDARIAWLKENRSEFVEHMPDHLIAKYLDVKLLRIDAIWSEAEILQRYLGYCETMSLSAYQEDLDNFTRWVMKNAQQGFDREGMSMKLWKSLTEENRRRFRRAEKVSDRKKILADSNPDSSTYQTDYLYPVMLDNCLGIDSNHSSYFAGSDFGGYGGSDSGGGDSGGGDGGGGGGGGE